AAQMGVLPINWNIFLCVLGTVPPLLHELAGSRPAAETKAERAQLEKRLQETPVNERLAVLQEFVAGTVRRVLGQAGPRDVGVERPLMELGMDSLMAVELRNVLGLAIEAVLPATLLFD